MRYVAIGNSQRCNTQHYSATHKYRNFGSMNFHKAVVGTGVLALMGAAWYSYRWAGVALVGSAVMTGLWHWRIAPAIRKMLRML